MQVNIDFFFQTGSNMKIQLRLKLALAPFSKQGRKQYIYTKFMYEFTPLSYVPSQDSDKAGHMENEKTFTGCPCNFVDFVIQRLVFSFCNNRI